MDKPQQHTGLNISVRSFLSAITVIFCLMVFTYVLTLFVPSGSFDRDALTGEIISGSYHTVDGGITLLKWLLSPVLVLSSSESTTVIAIIVFLFIIGGIFNSISEYGLLKYMLARIVSSFGKDRYRLMAIICFFFMAMGSLIGSFEEIIPLAPVVVALSISLGWDGLTGLAMSVLAIGCGFASGICNPFTIGVAQQLAGVPVFSGVWLRLVSFALIYCLLLGFIRAHAKKVERPVQSERSADFKVSSVMDRALRAFVIILGTGLAIVFASILISSLRDYTMVIMGLAFFAAGAISTLIIGSGIKGLAVSFGKGAISICPAVLMILMALSIKYTLQTSMVLDTILFGAIRLTRMVPRQIVILLVYLIAMVLNFFIPSGSAKAFILIPLIVPLAAQFGISAQLCVVAFAFGDGFSNVIYPTNPVLLMSLSLTDTSYGSWLRWSGKFQLLNLLLTSAILLAGLAIGY